MLQGQEIFVILLVALVVLGPQRLPELARKLGGWAAELRKAARELREGLEAEVGDLKGIQDEFRAPMKEVTDVMRDASRDLNEVTKPVTWVGPQPMSGPTAEDAADDLAEIERTGRPVTDEPDEPDDLAG
ncbi:MAG TPA: twin-arginine translocase TatA/TatE family subunit [Acidimicrobiia bacterium]|nr:twin-arginine translocase TatA/TatE family subunit [Acidimicrobiia bacterium]